MCTLTPVLWEPTISSLLTLDHSRDTSAHLLPVYHPQGHTPIAVLVGNCHSSKRCGKGSGVCAESALRRVSVALPFSWWWCVISSPLWTLQGWPWGNTSQNPTSDAIGVHEGPNSPGQENGRQYNSIKNQSLVQEFLSSLVPEDTAQEMKGLRCLADSRVHLNRCVTVVLHNAAKVLKIGHHLYRVMIRK